MTSCAETETLIGSVGILDLKRENVALSHIGQT